MHEATEGSEVLTDEWIVEHFDVHSPALAHHLHETLGRARALCPVAHTDRNGGHWNLFRYEDVLKTAQDWAVFSSELGITIPMEGKAEAKRPDMKILPVGIDPPLHREFKRLINAHFTPAAVAPWEEPTRALTDQLLDAFVERGSCEFMGEFARPLPGLAFFDLALHAPADELATVNAWATDASSPDGEVSGNANLQLAMWIAGFLEQRKQTGPRGDVVDAVLAAEIEGRPITFEEAIGTVHLLILGGLETTAGVLGMAMLRFCEHPEILAAIREQPELVPAAVEELLRLDGSFVNIARTARTAGDVDGHEVARGERVVLWWASANRDEAEFDRPDEFDLDRPANRHLAFGAGPHRCAGSNLARMNLRVALDAIAARLVDVELEPGARIEWHSTNSRAPLAVPIRFRPGPRLA